MNVLILGVGNILLSDEGIGVRAVEAFREHYHVPDGVDVVDGGTCGMDLLDIIAERDHVIVLDAVRLKDQPPATLIRLEDEQVPAFFRKRISPHQLGLSDVLAALKLLDREPLGLTLLGAVPESMEPGLELTPALIDCRDAMVELLVDELRILDIDPQPCARPANIRPART